MTDEELGKLLRTAVSPTEDDGPRADVWPALAARLDQGPRWSLLDLSLAAAVLVALLVNPEWFWLLAYHL